MGKPKPVPGLILAGVALFVFASKPCVALAAGPGEQWIQDETGWRYAAEEGIVAGGWREVDGEWYYFAESGYMATGWLHLGETKYWLSESGAMLHDASRTINGMDYMFDSSGACSLNWPYKLPTEILPDSEKSEMQLAADAMADEILSQIITEGMTKKEQAAAVYGWLRENIRYVNAHSDPDWITAAYNGLSRRRGECYTFFSMSTELLSRLGIPSIEVRRYRPGDSLEHMWNLVYCDDGWYHFDSTPRIYGGSLCLVTDAQLAEYSNAHHGCNDFDRSLYPLTP